MNTLRTDPARLSLARRPFLAEIRRRFAFLRKEIIRNIVTEDFLHIELPPAGSLTLPSGIVLPAWEGVQINSNPQDPEKLLRFQLWLQKQVADGRIDLGDDSGWSSKYIESAYKKGIVRSYMQASSSGPKYKRGTKEQFISDAFNANELASKVQLLAQKSYTGLQGVSSSMESDLQIELAKGLIEGRSASSVGRDIAERLDISRGKAERIARTELMYAHAEGQLDSLTALGIGDTKIVAEFSTAGDNFVCPRCQALEGKKYTVEEARGVIPVHPNCRCIWIPAFASK